MKLLMFAGAKGLLRHFWMACFKTVSTRLETVPKLFQVNKTPQDSSKRVKHDDAKALDDYVTLDERVKSNH